MLYYSCSNFVGYIYSAAIASTVLENVIIGIIVMSVTISTRWVRVFM